MIKENKNPFSLKNSFDDHAYLKQKFCKYLIGTICTKFNFLSKYYIWNISCYIQFIYEIDNFLKEFNSYINYSVNSDYYYSIIKFVLKN